MKRPKLYPPCSGWVSDLPEPTSPPTVPASLWDNSPNHMDDNYLEVCRPNSRARGIFFGAGLFMAAYTTFITIGPWSFFYLSELSIIISGVICTLVFLWGIAFLIKFDISPPRDLPLRFNRARQRMYAYNFNYRLWNPFERWAVAPVAYDWSQVRAERWSKRGVLPNGGIIFKWGVVLSIVEPGTNKVIDRFPLSTMDADEFAWAYICTYMQNGPKALPPPGIPRNHNDVPWYNIALRLAPKVQWPADMDRESRTAP